MIYRLLPEGVDAFDAAHIAGKMGKLNTIDFSFNLNDRYTLWSGLIGGTFLALSYFGTDQSQVQRYLAGSSVTQSRLGLLTNGFVKLPMQFFILFIGAMVFVFFQFIVPPLYFNPVEVEAIRGSSQAADYQQLEQTYTRVQTQKRESLLEMLDAIDQHQPVRVREAQAKAMKQQEKAEQIRNDAVTLIKTHNPASDGNDINYIFLSFVLAFLPAGLVGLVLAAILSASMSSTSAELNALASTSVMDIYKRMLKKEGSDRHYLLISKLATMIWGAVAIFFALFANRLGSLVEAVNILGSLFYGTILGIFLCAFYLKNLKGDSVFSAAVVSEIIVLLLFFFTDIPYLWFNFAGCILVVLIALVLEKLIGYRIKNS
jgi:Na+/proline symporter